MDKKTFFVREPRENLDRKYDLILKVKIDSTSVEKVLKFVEDRLGRKEKFVILTPNPEIVTLAQKDSDLMQILNSADLCIPDGVGIIIASRLRILLKKSRLKSMRRISGADLMVELIARSAQKEWKVFFLGGKPSVAEKAAKRLCEIYGFAPENFSYDTGPWLDKDGNPKNRGEENIEKETINKINKFRPDILFVGFGAPKQEKWIARNLPRLEIGGAMVVGGAFDFFSGRVKRAPEFVRKMGFEWLFRLILQPWRIGRQLSLFKFCWMSAIEAFVFKN